MNHTLRQLDAFPAPNAIDRLLESDEPISEEERVRILSRLQDLEPELECLSGKCIPIDIWQRVFEFVVFDPTMKDCDPLRTLSRVSRRWNAAASTHQILWSILPPVSLLNMANPITPRQHSAVRSRLQLFLSRSGSKKTDFQISYSSSEDVWRANRTIVLDILNIVVEVSHRWNEAVLHIPADVLEQALAPLRIHGRLPHLEKLRLELNVWGLNRAGLRQYAKLIRVDHFNNAPNLRHVTMNTSVISVPAFPAQILDDNNTIFDLHIPWSQIETYQSRIATSGREESCFRLIPDAGGGPHERLREVVYHVRNGSHPICNKASPIILSNLVKLCLRTGNIFPGDILFWHLNSRLILPSLSELEVRDGHFIQGPDYNVHWATMYHSVITLIRHSGCSNSLLRLRLEEKDGPRSADQLQELFLLCHNLEHLDIRVLQDQELQILRLGTNLPKLLPNLKVLCLRWPSEHTYHGSRTGVSGGREPPIVKPSTLWDVVQSRISTAAQRRSQLEEVRLLASSSSEEEYGVLTTQMNLLIGDSAWPFPAGSWANNTFDHEELSQLRTALQKKFKPIGGRYPTGAHVNLMLHWEMDEIMRKLEELNLGESRGVILARMGILYHLEEIAHTEEGVIPGDWMYNLRSRAANLLAKWKPIILPQFQALSLRWCYVPLGSARLQCQPMLNHNSNAAEDLAWKDAIGSAIN